MIDIKKNKELFIQICKENISRPIDNLLNYLCSSDFFIAPCSTKYHLNEPGGLCLHSLNVYSTLCELCCQFNISIEQNIETITIISLFHDICKSNFYSKTIKQVKQGHDWVNKEEYVINDILPLGHGEKSVMMIMSLMPLKQEEMLAIRWHMGGFDEAVKGGSYSLNTAYEKSDFVVLLQCADILSSKIIEKKC